MFTIKAISRQANAECVEVFEGARVEAWNSPSGGHLNVFGSTKGVEIDGERRIALFLRGNALNADESDCYDEIIVENAMGKTTHLMRASVPPQPAH